MMKGPQRTAAVNANIENDMEALTEEVKRLRADFAKIADLLRMTAEHAGEEAATQARQAGERAWTGAKSTADELLQRIEGKPVQSTAIAFGVGLIFGLLFGGRRS
jgi:ElaB/YqjD/DUF883 family membrane-anchored ribosome-binding protein